MEISKLDKDIGLPKSDGSISYIWVKDSSSDNIDFIRGTLQSLHKYGMPILYETKRELNMIPKSILKRVTYIKIKSLIYSTIYKVGVDLIPVKYKNIFF